MTGNPEITTQENLECKVNTWIHYEPKASLGNMKQRKIKQKVVNYGLKMV